MEKITDFNQPQLIEAVLIWTGFTHDAMPRRDDSLLVKRFGNDTAVEILPKIKSLEDDFYSSDARFVAADLQEMGKMAAEQFRKKHPGIAEEIVKAFAWCYTFDFK